MTSTARPRARTTPGVPMRSGSVARPQYGLAYLFLLIAVAVMGGAAATTVQMGSSMSRQAAERQLLQVGAQFANALESYATATPAGQATAPRELTQLLRDDRYPSTVRHLRRIYDDPLTGSAEWGLVRDAQGMIVGVHSLAEGEPIVQSGFPERFQFFAGVASYKDWIFLKTPQAVP